MSADGELRLAYERDAFAEFCSERGGTLVLAEGLGAGRVLRALVRLYASEKMLVLLVGAAQALVDAIRRDVFPASAALRRRAALGTIPWGTRPEELANAADENAPLVFLDAGTPPGRRAERYLRGGVVALTGRVLLQDLLARRVPAALVTGLLLLRPEDAAEGGTEAFCVALLRASNPAAFVQALCGRPAALAGASSRLPRLLSALGVPRLHLYPRFQHAVRVSLDNAALDVSEMRVPLGCRARQLQLLLLDVLNTALGDVLRANAGIDARDATPEAVLSGAFDASARRVLAPVWHVVGAKTRRLLREVRHVRALLLLLVDADAASFCRVLEALAAAEGADAYWLAHDGAQAALLLARERALLPSELPPKWPVLCSLLSELSGATNGGLGMRSGTSVDTASQSDSSVLPESGGSGSEDNSPRAGSSKRPIALSDSDGETADSQPCIGSAVEAKSRPADPIQTPPQAADDDRYVLVMVREERTRRMLVSLARAPSAEAWAAERAAAYDAWHAAAFGHGRAAEPRGSRRARGSSTGSNPTPADESESDDSGDLLDETPPDDDAGEPILCCGTRVLFAVYDSGDVDADVRHGRLLSRARHAALYDADLAFVRGLEAHAALGGACAGATLLVHGESVDEQLQLLQVRHEKEAFEALIRLRAISVDDPVPVSSSPVVPIDSIDATGAASRSYGGETDASTDSQSSQTIVVDVRELRSALPFVLHRRGFVLDAQTLAVGDYVLAPDMAAERKSIPDLLGSLASGRLYAQLERLRRAYAVPLLLIEFDDARPFSLAGSVALARDGNVRSAAYSGSTGAAPDVSSKLVLLLLHLRALRIVWSSSLAATAAIFSDLKRGRPQPNIGGESESPGSESNTGPGAKRTHATGDSAGRTAMDVLRGLPGVGVRGARALAARAGTLRGLSSLPRDELCAHLGAESGARLFSFLHGPIL